MRIVKEEPALIVGVVTAVIVLLVAFGVPISEDQRAAVVGVTAAVLALFGGGVAVRALVTPLANPKTSDGEPLVPASEAAPPVEGP